MAAVINPTQITKARPKSFSKDRELANYCDLIERYLISVYGQIGSSAGAVSTDVDVFDVLSRGEIYANSDLPDPFGERHEPQEDGECLGRGFYGYYPELSVSDFTVENITHDGELGFFGVSLTSQPASADQTALNDNTSGSVTNANLLAVNLTDNTGGTDGASLSDCSGLSTSDTYTDAAVNAKLDTVNDNFASIAARLERVNDNTAKTAELVNALRSALVTLGLIKGSA